jgi:hypothetical protein
VDSQYVAKQPLIKQEYSKEKKIQLLLNSVYQAQMHTLLAVGFGVKLCFVIDDSDKHLADFIWGIKTFKVMSD